jgi:hypothetical protein
MKTVGHSFRINEEYLAVLQEEAERQTISRPSLEGNEDAERL